MSRLHSAWLFLVVALLVSACSVQQQRTDGQSSAAVSGNAVGFAFTAIPSNVQAGSTAAFTVRAVDSGGNTATGYTGTVHLSANYPDTALSDDYTFVAADQGVHSFSLTPIEAGTQIVDVNDTDNPWVVGEAAITCVAGDATYYSIANLTSGSDLTAGVAAKFDIMALDAYWNIAANYNGTAVITSSDGAAILPANPKFVSGMVTGVSITFMTAGAQSVTATDSAISSMSDTAWAMVDASSSPIVTVTAPTYATANATGLVASANALSGATYTWSITNGSITSGAGTSSIHFSVGGVGTTSVSCTEKTSQGTGTGSATVQVVAAPVAPTISVASTVTSATPGLTATVTAHTGMTYAWSITNGTITSSTSGVTSGGVNTVTFTSGAPGTLGLSVTETNQANATSAPGTASVSVTSTQTQPVTPTITLAATAVTSGTSSSASVTAHTGMTYVWTISNGTITSAGGTSGVTSNGTNAITFTAGSAGTLTVTCAESNGSTTSAPASAAVTVVAAPQTPSISAPASVTAGQTNVTASVAAHSGMTYSWSISGGTITSGSGTSSITFTAGTSGTVSLSCVEVNSLGATSAPGSASITITGGSSPTAHLYVVAHQDDDLLFMNPDIERSIRSGRPTRVVYVTAAGSPDLATWQAREHGVYTPYMTMAQATFDPYTDSATYWTCGNHTYNGHAVRQCTLTQNPKVSVVFMRLPDGSLSSLWATNSGAPFYVAPVSSLTTADGANTYSKSSIIATIASIVSDFTPARVGILDSTFAYGDEHQDHVTSALFALDALHQWGGAAPARIYRGYTMDGEHGYYTIPAPEAMNLSSDEYAEKRAIMVAYSGDFPIPSTFDDWCHRRYAISSVAGAGPIAMSGACIDVQGGVTTDGTPVVTTTCSGSTSQVWNVTSDSKLVGPAGKCLTLGSGGAVTISTCSASAAQRWTLFANGQLRGQNGVCLSDAGGGSLAANLCDADRSGLQYQPLASQTFTMRASSSFAWSSGTNFSDADVGSLPASYRSLELFDLDGDGYGDACIRRGGGVYCARNGHIALASYSLFSATFSDGNGWSTDGYGSTVQYADVTGDGVPDVCARASNGIVCGTGSSTGFAAPSLWTSAFSDNTVFANVAYYRSIHFADVNGDGYADVCGRNASGITCALNAKNGSFATSTMWLTADFTDALGWSSDDNASTVQLADVDGDGLADVCGRGSAGITCATSNGTNAFVNDKVWSFRTDFSDAAGWNGAAGYYGSIHFGDVNGDGRADVCGRTSNGVVCAISDGVAFQDAVLAQPNAFTDAGGWKPDAYGTSMRYADVNHDGHADVCGRSSTGLVCVTMP